MPTDEEFARLVTAVERLTTRAGDLGTAIDRSARSLRRRWIFPIVAAVLVVAVGAGVFAWQAHDTAARFARTRQGLVDSCIARQQSDAALRANSQQLYLDTTTLARAMATSPSAAQLAPVVAFLDAQAGAYQAYLRSIPPPFDCQARYGR
jgi:hypothetical protein